MPPFLKRFAKGCVRLFVAAGGDWLCALAAPLVRFMAQSGAGTNACLKLRCLPLRVHFYSPVPDLADLARRGVWTRRSELPGVDLNIPGQLALLGELGAAFCAECDWPREPGADPRAFHTHNSSFSFGCAAALHTLLRRHRPRRVIEIGSGMSSLVISAALTRNTAAGAPPADYTIVDPFPGAVVAAGLPALSRLLRQPVETTDLALYTALGDGDVLFIDSGHTVKTGGDVNFVILDVLPRLASGVLVHFHDISLPDEYPDVYFTNPAFRVFWTEAYLLQAFLSGNRDWAVLLAMHYLMTDHAAAFARAFPAAAGAWPLVSGSFWLRRRPAGPLPPPTPLTP